MSELFSVCWFQSTAGVWYLNLLVCVCGCGCVPFDLFLGGLGRTAGCQAEKKEGYLQRTYRPKVPPAVVPSKWMSFTQESVLQPSAINQC